MINKVIKKITSEKEINYFNIRDFLETLTTPEYAEIIVHGRDLLVDMGYGAIDTEFDAIMRTQFNSTAESVLDDVNSLMTNVTTSVLKSHGILMEFNTPIYIKIKLLSFLFNLTDYYDPEQLLSSFQLEATEDPLVVFEDLLEEVVGEDEADLLISSVSSIQPALFKLIKAKLSEAVELLPSSDMFDITPIPDELVDTIKNLTNFIENKKEMILPYKIGSVIPLGLNVEIYLAEIISHYKETSNFKTLAGELIIAGLSSSLSIVELEKTLVGYFSYFHVDENNQLKTLVYLRGLLGAISNGAK